MEFLKQWIHYETIAATISAMAAVIWYRCVVALSVCKFKPIIGGLPINIHDVCDYTQPIQLTFVYWSGESSMQRVGTWHEIKSSRTDRPVIDASKFPTTKFPYSFQSCVYAASQRWNVSGGEQPLVDDERRPVAVQVILVVVGTGAVMVDKAHLGTDSNHLGRGRADTVGRPGPPCRSGGDRQRVEGSTDVVNAEFEDCSWSNDDLGADAAEGAAVNGCDVVTTAIHNISTLKHTGSPSEWHYIRALTFKHIIHYWHSSVQLVRFDIPPDI